MSIFLFKEKQDGTINAQLCGKVTRGPELSKSGKTVKFSVAYGEKKYMQCLAFADSDLGRKAGSLEVKDRVCVMGTMTSNEYDGKTYYSVMIDWLSVEGEGIAQPTFNQAATAMASGGNAKAEENGGFAEQNDDDGELPF